MSSIFNKIYYFIVSVIIFYFIYSNDHWLFPIERYKNSLPTLDIQEFFSGEIYGYGVLNNFNDTLNRRFNITINGKWASGRGAFVQQIIFYDKPEEINSLVLEGSYVDKNQLYLYSDQILHNATIKQYGSVGSMEYVLKLKHPLFNNITIYNKMTLINKNTMIVQSRLKKIGFVIGTATVILNRL
jgi:hypothetical protein